MSSGRHGGAGRETLLIPVRVMVIGPQGHGEKRGLAASLATERKDSNLLDGLPAGGDQLVGYW